MAMGWVGPGFAISISKSKLFLYTQMAKSNPISDGYDFQCTITKPYGFGFYPWIQILSMESTKTWNKTWMRSKKYGDYSHSKTSKHHNLWITVYTLNIKGTKHQNERNFLSKVGTSNMICKLTTAIFGLHMCVCVWVWIWVWFWPKNC